MAHQERQWISPHRTTLKHTDVLLADFQAGLEFMTRPDTPDPPPTGGQRLDGTDVFDRLARSLEVAERYVEQLAHSEDCEPTDLDRSQDAKQTAPRLFAGLKYSSGYLATIAVALFASGAAGLVNQVVWLRCLKTYLGGSHAITSMIVMMVLMGGLGFGSLVTSRLVRRMRSPLQVLAAVEILLAIVNLGICILFAVHLESSWIAVQRWALEFSIPLPAVYAIGACSILGVPCLLLGATLPLAAEALQRELGLRDSRLLGPLFAVMTVGGVTGTVITSGWMLAEWGYRLSLMSALCLNVAAGGILMFLYMSSTTKGGLTPADAKPIAGRKSVSGWRLTLVLAFACGFLSLSYGMYLLRLLPLRHGAVPLTYAAVITGCLVGLSVGAVWSAKSRSITLSAALRVTALSIVATVPAFAFDSRFSITDTGSMALFVLARCIYFVPCVMFGYQFSLLNRFAASSWGRDVGRIAAWSALGSCLGIAGTTLIGFKLPFFLLALVLALTLYALQELVDSAPIQQRLRDARASRRWMPPAIAAAAVVVSPYLVNLNQLIPNMTMYSGRDGVIIVQKNGDVICDGLWQTRLSNNDHHIGSRNWYAAVCPVVCHSSGEIEDVCILGVSTGITASTLTKLDTVRQVDAYEIHTMWEQVYRDYPAETLHLSENETIHLIWNDPRSGLNLNDKQYDLIQAQPVDLKRFGSGLLSSLEFYRLVQSRLKPGGVFCLDSTGTPEQSFVARATARRVFAHSVSFFDGSLLVLSDTPIDINPDRIRSSLTSADPLWTEIRSCNETQTAEQIMRLVAPPIMAAGDDSLLITDDHPIVEYPHFLKREVRARYPDLDLN